MSNIAPTMARLFGISRSNAEAAEERFASFAEFYPFYLSEHRDPVSRRLHVAGSGLALAAVAAALARRDARLLLVAPLVGYGFAWLGHFKFERNRPATFKYPLFSLMGDWVFFFEVLTGRRKL